MSDLINHPVWNHLSQIITEIDCYAIAKKHLESCSQKIYGYWDSRNEFYEEIAFVGLPVLELTNSGIGINQVNGLHFCWIKLEFLLKVDEGNEQSIIDDDEIGDLTLILDANLKVVDENWSVDVESPFVVATKHKENVEFRM